MSDAEATIHNAAQVRGREEAERGLEAPATEPGPGAEPR
jgi:hypothetical protein